MVSSLLAVERADRSTELAFDDDQRFVQQRAAACSDRGCEVRDEVAEAEIELSRRVVDSCVCLVDVRVVVPAAQIDLEETRSHIGGDEVASDDTRITKT